jgi:hypothetical protein
MSLVMPADAQRITGRLFTLAEAISAAGAIAHVRVLTPGRPEVWDQNEILKRETPELALFPQPMLDTVYQVRILEVLKPSPRVGAVGGTIVIGHPGEARGLNFSNHVPDTNWPVLQLGHEYLVFLEFREAPGRLMLVFDTTEVVGERLTKSPFPDATPDSELDGRTLAEVRALVATAH